MTSLEHLLPGPDEQVRCADHGRTIGLDPGGTAIRADRLVVVATPQPWPKPVFAHTLLSGIKEALGQAPYPVRVLAAVPEASGRDGGVEVVVYDRADGTEVFEHRYTVADQPALLALAERLATTAPGEACEGEVLDQAGPLSSPVALVCTQGSHDVCCGSDGARFAAEAESIDGLTVRRVSHTGGHRFAPTLVTLPDGRMWADADLDLLRQVLWRTGEAADVVDRCRGWWGADTGPAQVAEIAVLAHVGWELESTERSITIDPDPDGDGEGIGDTAGVDGMRVEITAGADSWSVAVAPGREVPTIGCRVPGGLPAKTHREYDVTTLAPSG